MSAKFLSRTETQRPDAIEIDGAYFVYQSFDAETEQALSAAADKYYVLWEQNESISDDGWGDHKRTEKFSLPLTKMRSLTETFATYWVSGDILIENGAVAGIVVFTAADWNYDRTDSIIPVKVKNSKYVILYLNENPPRRAFLSYSGDAGRVWCSIDGTISYSLVDKLVPRSTDIHY